MTELLKNMKCKPCSGNTLNMNQKEILLNLDKINNWEINNEKKMIYKKFKFKNFKKSLEFSNHVGKIAEEEGHHPDLWFGWGYARIKIFTHAIKGLAESDFILAAKIDKISNV